MAAIALSFYKRAYPEQTTELESFLRVEKQGEKATLRKKFAGNHANCSSDANELTEKLATILGSPLRSELVDLVKVWHDSVRTLNAAMTHI